MSYTDPDHVKVSAPIERGAEAMHSRFYWASTLTFAEIKAALHEAVGEVLSVEEMARILHREGAWCGVCEYDGWDACRECRETVTGYAAAIRAAILGTAP